MGDVKFLVSEDGFLLRAVVVGEELLGVLEVEAGKALLPTLN